MECLAGGAASAVQMRVGGDDVPGRIGYRLGVYRLEGVEWAVVELAFVGCHAGGIPRCGVQRLLVWRKGNPGVRSGRMTDVRDVEMGKERVEGEGVYVRDVERAHE